MLSGRGCGAATGAVSISSASRTADYIATLLLGRGARVGQQVKIGRSGCLEGSSAWGGGRRRRTSAWCARRTATPGRCSGSDPPGRRRPRPTGCRSSTPPCSSTTTGPSPPVSEYMRPAAVGSSRCIWRPRRRWASCRRIVGTGCRLCCGLAALAVVSPRGAVRGALGPPHSPRGVHTSWDGGPSRTGERGGRCFVSGRAPLRLRVMPLLWPSNQLTPTSIWPLTRSSRSSALDPTPRWPGCGSPRKSYPTWWTGRPSA